MIKLSRRRDYLLQPLTKETADPDAATAAASAFMRGNPAPSLSSAAAAAALRARPTTPTNVAEISSKRTQRRTSSLSSPAGRDRSKKNKHYRSPSVSSLTERTFRSPSPGRTAPRKQDVPPVPSISASKTTAIPLQTQNFQPAGQKSEGLRQGSWFGAAATQHAYQEKRAESMSRLTPDLPESRSGSVSSSINFSYPRTRITSCDSHVSFEHDLVYDPNSRRMVLKDALVPISHQIESASSTPPERVKGAKLVKRGHIPQGLADDARLAMPDSMRPEPFLIATSQSHATGASYEDSPDGSSSCNPSMPATAEGRLSQEREPEAENPKDWHNHNASQNEAREAVMEPSRTPSLPKHDNWRSEIPFAYAGSGSETSVRSAHFASSTDRLVVKHEPPPRSLSPRKSAMKPTISNRGDQSSHPHESLEYPALGAYYPGKEDSMPSQRKGARVSWNDDSTIRVAEPGKSEEAECVVTPGIQARQGIYNAVDELKAIKASSPQQDESMSPRPALPLFGSVREKKGKEPEERQLVRPRERSLSPQSSPPSHPRASSFAPKIETISPVEPVKGLSYNREQTSRNVANISKYREPLPVIIASTESLEHDSEDMYTSDDERFEDVSTGTEHSMIQRPLRDSLSDSSLPSHVSTDEALKANSSATDAVLGISNPGTYPLLPRHQDVTPMSGSKSLPGSFPHDEDAAGSRASDVGESNPPILAQASGSKSVNQDDLLDESKQEEDSDRDSIYSDAYEDLSEVTDGGFMSLNATLASPSLAKSGGNNRSFGASHGRKPSDNVLGTSIQSSDDWERTKAYWKSLTSEERRRLEMEALQEADGDGDDVTREGFTAKGPAALPDILGYSSDAEQKKQVHRPRSRHPSRSDLVSPETATRHPVAFQDQASGSAGFGPRNQSKKDGSVEWNRGGGPMEHTNPALIDAQRGHGSPQQSVATTHSDIATGSRSKNRAQIPRSTASEQRRKDDEIRDSIIQQKWSYNSLTSTEPNQGRQLKYTTDGWIEDPTLNPGTKSSLRRRGSDSSESSFIRSRAIANPHRGLRVSMRSNASDSKISLAGKKGRKRLTLRSLSPAMSHAQQQTVASIPPSLPLVEKQRHRRFHQGLAVPHISQSQPRKYEDSTTWDDHNSDSSDDDMNATPLSNRSMTGDGYEPVHSRLKNSIIHMYTRNGPPDRSSSGNAGFAFNAPKHDALKLRDDDRLYDDGNAHMPIEQLSSHPPTAQPSSVSGHGAISRPDAAAQEASPRRQGLISTLRRKRDGNVRDSREMSDASPSQNAIGIIQHNTGDDDARSSGIPNHAQGWPLQNRKSRNEGSMTSPAGEIRSRSAASGSLVQEELTSEPRHPHELQHDTSEPKRKKFNSLRKMFKINN